jgi:ech hydrogenase subunit D
MFEEQNIRVIEKKDLVNRTRELQEAGQRFVQASCAVLDQHLQVDYSFDKDYQFTNLRVLLPKAERQLPSISKVYFTAALYENELHDLFDILIDGMLIDFHGNFYRTAKKAPFLDTSNISVVTNQKNEG